MRPSISLRTNGAPTAPATPSLSNGPSRSNGSRASPRTDFPAPSRPRAPFDFPQDERGPNRSGHPELVEWAQPFEWFESLTTNGLPGPIPAPCALRFPSGRTGPQPLRPPRACRMGPAVRMVREPHHERTSRPHPGPVRPSISLRTNGSPTAPATLSLSNGPSRSNGSRASPRTD